MSMTTGFWNFWRNSVATLAQKTTASGSSPLHVEDRRLDHLGDVGRIGRGARIARIGGEADLVVDDEMDRAAGAVALQARQAETFGDHALAGESRVAVDQQRQDRRAGRRARGRDLVLLGAHLAEHDRIDDLEMRGVGGQRQMDLVAVELAVGRGAEVIFDVARAFDSSGRKEPPLNSWKRARCGLPITWHSTLRRPRWAMPSTISFTPSAPPRLMICSSAGNHRFAAVEAEALGAGVAHVEELLEALGLDQLLAGWRACPPG